MKSILQPSLLAVAIATTGAVAFSGCASDSPAEPTGKAGTAGSGAGGRSGGTGGTSPGGTTGEAGAAGAEGGEAGSSGSNAGRGGNAGSSQSGGRAGSAAQSGGGGTAGEQTDGGAAGSQAGEGGSGPAPGCSTADDQCPTGNYCATDGGECVPGCKNGGACASGRCNDAHECDSCVADAECGAGRVCGDGACHDPCGDAPLAECSSTELDCCGSRCVETDHDLQNCGGCGIACSDSQFCSSEGCAATTFANLCKVRSVVVLIDEQPGDLAPARALGSALAATCSPAPPVVEMNEVDATVINPSTGQPLGGGDLLAVAGGWFGQDVVRYLEAQRTTPLYPSVDTSGNYEIRRAGSDALVASFPVSSVGPSHDYLTIEVARDSTTGAFAVIAYGFTEYGTAAAVWYFANVVLPDLATREGTYYVLEWTDDGNLTPDVADTFTLIQSGP